MILCNKALIRLVVIRFCFFALLLLSYSSATNNCNLLQTVSNQCIDLSLCPPQNVTIFCTLEYDPVCGKIAHWRKMNCAKFVHWHVLSYLNFIRLRWIDILEQMLRQNQCSQQLNEWCMQIYSSSNLRPHVLPLLLLSQGQRDLAAGELMIGNVTHTADPSMEYYCMICPGPWDSVIFMVIVVYQTFLFMLLFI